MFLEDLINDSNRNNIVIYKEIVKRKLFFIRWANLSQRNTCRLFAYFQHTRKFNQYFFALPASNYHIKGTLPQELESGMHKSGQLLF